MADFATIFLIILVSYVDLILSTVTTTTESIKVFYQNTPCNNLPLTLINCSYKLDCIYGEKTSGNCTAPSDIVCLGERTFQVEGVPCYYCFQLPKETHNCELPTDCQSTSHKPVIAKCSVGDHQHCFGNRTFSKSVKCDRVSGYHWSTAFILSVTLGGFGVDRFYLGFWKEGLGKLFSFGGLGVWTLIDIVLIGVGYIKPEDGSFSGVYDLKHDVETDQITEEEVINNKMDFPMNQINDKERLETVYDVAINEESVITKDIQMKLFETLGKLHQNPSYEEIEREFIQLLGSDDYDTLKNDIKNVPYDDFMKAKKVFDKYRFLDGKTLNEEFSISAPQFLTLKGKIDKLLAEKNSAQKSVETSQSHRYPCKPFNLTSPGNSSVTMINSDAAMTEILTQMNETKGCALVLFYSPYCEFSARIAPLYNAAGRSYPFMPVIALDAQSTIGMSARYGIVGIPTIILFYSGKAMGKFNGSRTVQHMHYFIKDNTGFDPIAVVNITEEDFKGPLSSIVKESSDYFLIFSTIFLLSFVLWITCGTYVIEMSSTMYIRWSSRSEDHQKVD